MGLGLLCHDCRADRNCCLDLGSIGKPFQPYTSIKPAREARIMEIVERSVPKAAWLSVNLKPS